jgi:hypothetical protein
MTSLKGRFFALNSKQINAAVMKTSEYSPDKMENLDMPVYFAQGAHDMATPT